MPSENVFTAETDQGLNRLVKQPRITALTDDEELKKC